MTVKFKKLQHFNAFFRLISNIIYAQYLLASITWAINDVN